MDCLFLPPDCGADLTTGRPLYWLPEKVGGQHLYLSDCATALLGRPQALVLPVECCSAFIVSLPTEKARWLHKALPYALEDLLAEDVEQLHLALGERMADGRHRVLAVRRELLAGWLEQLKEQGVRVESIYMDADLLPREDGQLLLSEGRVLLGGVGETRMACLQENWPALVGSCTGPLHAYGVKTEGLAGSSDYQCVENSYSLLAAGCSAAVNLAQGEFALHAPSRSRALLKPLLACAGLLLLLQLTFNLAQGWHLTRQGDAYAAASRALYQELFPEDQRIVNLRAQFDEHLRRDERTSGSAGFLGILERSAEATSKVPMVTIQQLDYQHGLGELSMQVHASDFVALEQLRAHLGATGMGVQMGSASREEHGVSARVVISVAAPGNSSG